MCADENNDKNESELTPLPSTPVFLIAERLLSL